MGDRAASDGMRGTKCRPTRGTAVPHHHQGFKSPPPDSDGGTGPPPHPLPAQASSFPRGETEACTKTCKIAFEAPSKRDPRRAAWWCQASHWGAEPPAWPSCDSVSPRPPQQDPPPNHHLPCSGPRERGEVMQAGQGCGTSARAQVRVGGSGGSAGGSTAGIGFWGSQREFVGFHAAVAASLFPVVSPSGKRWKLGLREGGRDNGGMGERQNGDGDEGLGMGEWGWERRWEGGNREWGWDNAGQRGPAPISAHCTGAGGSTAPSQHEGGVQKGVVNGHANRHAKQRANGSAQSGMQMGVQGTRQRAPRSRRRCSGGPRCSTGSTAGHEAAGHTCVHTRPREARRPPKPPALMLPRTLPPLSSLPSTAASGSAHGTGAGGGLERGPGWAGSGGDGDGDKGAEGPR